MKRVNGDAGCVDRLKSKSVADLKSMYVPYRRTTPPHYLGLSSLGANVFQYNAYRWDTVYIVQLVLESTLTSSSSGSPTFQVSIDNLN